jgi:hypothetical protein
MAEEKQTEEMDIEELESQVEDTPDKTEQEFVDDFGDMDIDELVPSMNVSKDMVDPEQDNMVENEDLWGIYNEVLDNCRKDRVAVDEVLVNFIDMVMNEGDASSASKEAIVNLLKIKSDSADKMSKIADLMTRIKLKERDTFPRYLAAQQNNKVVIEGSKREMIKSINKLAAKKKLTASRTNNDQAN